MSGQLMDQWKVETATVDTKTGFNHVYENIYYEARLFWADG